MQPITHMSSCLCCPISQIETNHCHLLTEFADWVKNGRLQKRAPPLKTSPTTYRYVSHAPRTSTDFGPDPNDLSSRRKRQPFQSHDDISSYRPHRLQANHRQKTRPTAMPTDALANGCYFDSDMPIRSRNPHTRDTTKYTKRQNINRNVRLHLRNDRKIFQNDLLLA
jgi:hypothetical protein